VDDDELNDVRDAWREAGRDPADLEFLEIEDLLSPRTFGAEMALIAVKDPRTGRRLRHQRWNLAAASGRRSGGGSFRLRGPALLLTRVHL